MDKITPPSFKKTSFNCPNCNAFSHQVWRSAKYYEGGSIDIKNLEVAFCLHCKKFSLWLNEKMIYPDISGVQPPNQDLNKDIIEDYIEATSILNKSPRGAAALLRLCIQKLCKQLGESGENINKDIANLVQKGLPATVQQALDIVRVVGNNAVHPGQIDLKDDTEIANKLFELINIVAHIMITQPKEIKKLYNKLPETQRNAITDRDN